MRYVFGPVPSRRLGISLGVDIVPYKTCTLDCVYCECGRTVQKTGDRKRFVEPEEVKRELGEYLSRKPDLDYITFSGGGEPLLNSGIGEIIEFLKAGYGAYRLALITNGTLLRHRAVRGELHGIDLMIPSVDAVSEDVFALINSPCAGVRAADVIEGVRLFRRENSARVWVEVFIVPGVNDTSGELELLKEALLSINPHKVQLNTLDRPGTEPWVSPAPAEKLEEIRQRFSPLYTEIISPPEKRKIIKKEDSEDIKEMILSVLSRRPSTFEDLHHIFNFDIIELEGYLRELEDSGRISAEEKPRGIFFRTVCP